MQTQLIHLGPVFSTSARGSECPVQTQFEKKWNIAVPAFHWTCSIEVLHENMFAWLIHINATWATWKCIEASPTGFQELGQDLAMNQDHQNCLVVTRQRVDVVGGLNGSHYTASHQCSSCHRTSNKNEIRKSASFSCSFMRVLTAKPHASEPHQF